MASILAPWTPEQVAALQRWQAGGGFHPFTCCGHDDCTRPQELNEGILIPTTTGWYCPCGKYTQNWCHDFMLDPPAGPHVPAG
jgi:hypothetical protein